jgi:hypothetical protein
MGCFVSHEEVEVKYTSFDEIDRDDEDVPGCGCGPYYGGVEYRELRRRNLPGYGSPPGNTYGRGGYAGRYGGDGREYIKPILPPHVASLVPPMMEQDIFFHEEAGPMVSVDAVPSRLVTMSNTFPIGEFPYQRRRPNAVNTTPAMW